MTRNPREDIPLEKALALALAKMTPLREIRTLPLRQTRGRILREDITAAIDVPPHDTAAVDGYAFYADDLATATRLPVIGEARPGHPYRGAIKRGVAWRVFTGAAMPQTAMPRAKNSTGPATGGPDSVAMEEDCKIDSSGHVIIPATAKPGSNCRPRGENVARGTKILTSGTRLGASELGLAASLGRARLRVAAPLTIAIMSTGDEIGEAGTPPQKSRSDMLYDSNRPMLAALLADDGMEAVDGGIIPDDRKALARAFKSAARNPAIHAIISTGGSSAGAEDHARPAILAVGGAVDFWRLAIKPGRPMAMGWIAGKPVFCLPGNPVASFVCYRMVALPCLIAMAGGRVIPPLRLPAPAGFSHRKTSPRTEYLRARLAPDESGRPAIHIHGRKGAGVLSSLTGADGLVEIPAKMQKVAKGDMLDFIPMRERGL